MLMEMSCMKEMKQKCIKTLFQKKESKEKKRLTLVSDKTRVIKGASWKDRAFWLDPAQRRYMPEFLAADYIGFRCAMSYLGSTSESRKPRGIPKN